LEDFHKKLVGSIFWIEKGYELQWTDKPLAQRIAKNSASALTHASFVSSAVEEMLAAEAISILPKGERPEVVSPLGVVPKGTEGKFRLIINIMSYVNEHLVKQKFKFEGLKDMANMAEKGNHAVSFDLTSGYYPVGLHPRTRTFTGLECKGSYYFYNCLPFGLATTPWVFSKVMRELVMDWRKGGISVLPYLDDFFFTKKGSQACMRLCRRVKQDFYDACLIINVPKCQLDPALCLRQPGFDVDMG
jgi:hypothetical protein